MRTKMPTSIILVFIFSFVISDAASNQYSDIFRAYPSSDVPYSSTGSYIIAARGETIGPVDTTSPVTVSAEVVSDTVITPSEPVVVPAEPRQKNIPKKTSAHSTVVVHTDEIEIFPELLSTPERVPPKQTPDTDSDPELRDSVLQALSEF